VTKRDDTKNKIEGVLKSLGVSGFPIDYEKKLSELGLDSLHTMDLVLSLEDAFQVQVPEEDLNDKNLRSAGTVLALFERLRG
jgi:acyl carrier protein